MNKKILLTVAILLTAIMVATPLLATVQAEPRMIVTRGSYLGRWYTQTNIVLGDANNTIRIPDNWNGKLVVLCRGFSHILNPNTIPMDSQSKNFTWQGYATAASNYGTGGYSVKEGMIRTHQLTEYVIDNYGVTGRVYLVGISMGGNTVLNLGAKYPDLYDGVLDLCGSKNLTSQYYEKMVYASLTDDAALTAALIAHGSAVPPYPITSPLVPGPLHNQLNAFRNFSLTSGTDIALACGGTPEEKPKAYERISPTYSAVDIAVPTITVHGTSDGLVPYSSAIEFMNAVAAAGSSDLYRLYKVVGGQHGDPAFMNQAIGVRFPQLVNWVETGVPALPSDP